ncbi:MAG: hypothetical protein IT368_13525 [Candidatus Hydrogenedentes bacterium]|nr:hypothetical protein [Candidatus Hydrogenedentota bacterium]
MAGSRLIWEVHDVAVDSEGNVYRVGTEWKEMRSGEVVARELYDHRTDPAENENVVDAPENADFVKELAGMLAAGYEAARPQG